MIIYSGSLAPVMREYERRKAITFKVKYLFFGVSFWFLFWVLNLFLYAFFGA